MNTMAFDTLKISNRLRSEGFTEQQAAALTDTVREVATAVADAQDLDGYSKRSDLNLAVSELKADMSALKADVIKWMFGGFLTVIGMLVAVLLKMP